jgi:hypothetical protein
VWCPSRSWIKDKIAGIGGRQDASLNRRQIALSDASERTLAKVYSAHELEA